MNEAYTTAIVQRYLDALAEEGSNDPLVQSLLDRAAGRLHLLCNSLLYRSYPRLTRPPSNLQEEELLGGVVERLLKSLRSIRPRTVRQFFALANQHIRWELNDLARRLDEQMPVVEQPGGFAAAPSSSSGGLSLNARRMLEAIEALPEEEREVFDLVRIQGLAQTEVAELLGISTKTVQRRLNRALLKLADLLNDLRFPRGQSDGV